MKEFNFEESKNGKSVCTRSGNNVEILKWNARGKYPIIGIINLDDEDIEMSWTKEGKTAEYVNDLVMIT